MRRECVNDSKHQGDTHSTQESKKERERERQRMRRECVNDSKHQGDTHSTQESKKESERAREGPADRQTLKAPALTRSHFPSDALKPGRTASIGVVGLHLCVLPVLCAPPHLDHEADKEREGGMYRGTSGATVSEYDNNIQTHREGQAHTHMERGADTEGQRCRIQGGGSGRERERGRCIPFELWPPRHRPAPAHTWLGNTACTGSTQTLTGSIEGC